MSGSPWMRLHQTPAQSAWTALVDRPRRTLARALMSPLLSHAEGICVGVVTESVETSFDGYGSNMRM